MLLHWNRISNHFLIIKNSEARYLPHHPIDPDYVIDKGQSESPRGEVDENTFHGVDDSDLLNYLARDPKVAAQVIEKAKRINLR